jgi:prepilin-type N-terminal cleavage/methylation domain-containing protein
MNEKRKPAFTLIELLAVMTIILVLAAMVLYTARFVTEKAKRARAEAYVKAKCAEAEAFYAEHRYYPAWSSNGIGTDPWDMPYIYLAYSVAGVGYTQRQQFAVYCMGPDQTPGAKERPGTTLGDGDDITMGNYGRTFGTSKD